MLSVCHVATAVGRIALLMLGVMLSWPAMDWADAITVPLTGGTSGFNGGSNRPRCRHVRC